MKMIGIGRLCVAGLIAVFLVSCTGVAPSGPPDAPNNPALQITPSVQPVSDEAIESKVTEVQTPEPDSNQQEDKKNNENNAAQVVNRVSEEISGNTGGYFLLQFKTTLNPSLEQQLADTGIILYDPLENYVYQAYIPGTALPALEELLQRNEILSVAVIPSQGKIKSPLDDPDQVKALQSYQITVQFFEALTPTEKETLEKIMTVDEYAEGVMNFAHGHASGNDLRSIAELPFVKLIEETVPASGGGSQ